MTIFHFSAAIAAIFLTGCANNMPSRQTELGRITRIANFANAESQLRIFTENGLRDRAKLRTQFAAAGFVASSYWDDEMALQCEAYNWTGKDWGDAFYNVFIVRICKDNVFTTAESIAP